MRPLGIVMGAAIALFASEALPCNDWGWSVGGHHGGIYPANAAILLQSPEVEGLVIEADGERVSLVAADFPFVPSIFLAPLPQPGQNVTLLYSSSNCPECEGATADWTVGDHDLDPPVLETPLYYDLDVHVPTDALFEEDVTDTTYVLRVDALQSYAPELAFVTLYAGDAHDEPLVTEIAEIGDDCAVKISIRGRSLGDTQPVDACLSVHITDTAGNALEQVMLCAPCHYTHTASNQTVDWSDATLYPGGICAAEMPAPEHLPLAPLPAPESSEESSGCSAGGKGGTQPWLALAALMLLARPSRPRRATVTWRG